MQFNFFGTLKLDCDRCLKEFDFPVEGEESLVIKYGNPEESNDEIFDDRKKHLKRRSFEIVADQTGKLFDPNILTIVWARRFAGYKRADMLTYDMERFERMLSNTKYPVQVIWAGKAYPVDYPAISQFNNLVQISKKYKNVAVLVGYELALSKRLKQASDVG